MEDTGPDGHDMPGDRAMVDEAFVQQEMLVGKIAVDTTLNQLGMLYNRMPVDSISANARRMTEDCLKGSYPGYIKLKTSCKASIACDYYGNYSIYLCM